MATEKLQVYKCMKCGNMVDVLHAGGGVLTCCGEAMKLYKENTTDGATEKHVPVIEKTEGGFKVTVGSVAHPMQDDHYIEWIEAMTAMRPKPFSPWKAKASPPENSATFTACGKPDPHPRTIEKKAYTRRLFYC